MSLSSFNYTLSNINAILGSTLSYVDEKQAGDKSGAAEVNFGFNVCNGLLRNAGAEYFRRHTGSYLGYTINSLAGYGNAASNYYGSMGLLGLSMMTNPFRFFGGCSPMFGIGCCNNFLGMGGRFWYC